MYASEVFLNFPDLARLLDAFTHQLQKFIPEHTSSYLFGGITLGDFSPKWSDVDIVVWVDEPYVSDNIVDRSFQLWSSLAEMTHGSQVYMYIAPNSVASGPMNPAGGGTVGEPRSLRVYRNKWREMSGYPLSLPDTVCLRRHGVLLTGRDDRHKLPAVHDHWIDEYLQIQISELTRAVRQKVGPFGDDPHVAVTNWGPEGLMTYPLLYARHLYSLSHGGKITSKEKAVRWYLEHHSRDTLYSVLETILKWRTEGAEPEEVDYVATFTKPSTMDFLRCVAALKGLMIDEPSSELSSTLEYLMHELAEA